MADLLWKQKRIVESLKWTMRAIKSTIGQYSFDVSDDTLNNVRKAYNEKKVAARNKDAYQGGILLEIISLFFAFISFLFVKEDIVQDYLPNFIFCVLFSAVPAVLGCLTCIPRVVKKSEPGKHIITLILGVVSIGLLVCSLCMLI